MPEFALIASTWDDGKTWGSAWYEVVPAPNLYDRDRTIYRNTQGGYMHLGMKGPPCRSRIEDQVEADRFEDLDWQRTSLFKPNPATGEHHAAFLGPNGEVLACRAGDRDRVIRLHFEGALPVGWTFVFDLAEAIESTRRSLEALP
jgi:hypothetical protein